jgi:hypothetical protein
MSANAVTRRGALKFAGLITLAAYSVRAFPGYAGTAPARGYGPDPDLLQRTVTWPRTLSAQQLAVLKALCDIVLPAEPPHPSAGTVGVQEFLDEWVSAPYLEMQADRRLLLRGLNRLEEAMRRKHSGSFIEATLSQQIDLFAESCSNEMTRSFARRLIELICAGYYTTREGHKPIGYIGNVALASYPEPPPEIVRHFEQALNELMLTPLTLTDGHDDKSSVVPRNSK